MKMALNNIFTFGDTKSKYEMKMIGLNFYN